MNDKSFLIENYLGAKVRYYRSSKGYTMQQLADHFKISYQQMQKYETGVDRLRASRIYEISKLLDVPIMAFFPPEFHEKHVRPTDVEDVYKVMSNYSMINSNKAKEVIAKSIEIFVSHQI